MLSAKIGEVETIGSQCLLHRLSILRGRILNTGLSAGFQETELEVGFLEH